MIKISKILLIITLFFSIFIMTSCDDNVYEYENGIDIHVSDELIPYMMYQNELPVLHFDYDNVKCYVENSGSSIFFVHNDSFILSEKFSEHLKRYNEDQIFVLACEEQTIDHKTGLFNGEKLLLDETDPFGNKQEYSKEYQIVCVDETLNGTRYSYQYRLFYSQNKSYYSFRYSSNIGISLEQSLMVVKKDGKNQLVLLPIPYDIKYEVSFTTAKLKNLVEKDTYLNEKYYKFAYSDMFNEYSIEDRDQMIIDWYKRYCNLEEVNNEYLIHYCGATFKVIFGYNDCGKDQNKTGFKLEFVK